MNESSENHLTCCGSRSSPGVRVCCEGSRRSSSTGWRADKDTPISLLPLPQPDFTQGPRPTARYLSSPSPAPNRLGFHTIYQIQTVCVQSYNNILYGSIIGNVMCSLSQSNHLKTLLITKCKVNIYIKQLGTNCCSPLERMRILALR